jgi:NAD-dependent deacetylase
VTSAVDGRAAILLRGAGRVTVLTGAGISTDSGIPDYRGPNGVWTRDPQAQRRSTLADYVAEPAVRASAWRHRLRHPAWTAEPNPAHRALVALERSGRLVALLTQNVDGLHQRAGSDPDLVVELHGTIWWARCLACAARTPMQEELDRVRAGAEDPPCRACGGMLTSATVSFGEPLDPLVLERARRAASGCDLFLVIGSSLSVHPAAGLCSVAAQTGARLVILNAEPTPYDHLAETRLSAPIGASLPALLAGIG